MREVKHYIAFHTPALEILMFPLFPRKGAGETILTETI